MSTTPDLKIYRLHRVLEYFGTLEDLTTAQAMRQVKGVHSFDGRVKIYEGIVGDTAQPIISQLTKWCMEQIVEAAEGRVYPDDNSMRDGYVEAVQDVLRMTLPKKAYDELCRSLPQ